MTLILPTLACNRCGHKWTPRQPREPGTCPRCRSPYWNKPRMRPRPIKKKAPRAPQTDQKEV